MENSILTQLYKQLLEVMIYSHVKNYGFNFKLYTYNYDNLYSTWIEPLEENENLTLYTQKQNITFNEFLDNMQLYTNLYKSLTDLDTLNVVLVQIFDITDNFSNFSVKFISKSEYLDLRSK